MSAEHIVSGLDATADGERWGGVMPGALGAQQELVELGGQENALGLATFDVCTKAETSGWSSPKALAG